MVKNSAGILAWRMMDGNLEVLLAHPGGPFFSNKNDGAWTIPKGEIEDGEAPLSAAKREFIEEVGLAITGDCRALAPVKQKSGKVVYAWAVSLSLDIADFRSNTFTMEWPPRSGKMQEFPEIDKVEWFKLAVAKEKINGAQIPFFG